MFILQICHERRDVSSRFETPPAQSPWGRRAKIVVSSVRFTVTPFGWRRLQNKAHPAAGRPDARSCHAVRDHGMKFGDGLEGCDWLGWVKLRLGVISWGDKGDKVQSGGNQTRRCLRPRWGNWCCHNMGLSEDIVGRIPVWSPLDKARRRTHS